MKYTIYCDLDGVLVDFNKGYYELTGTDTTNYIKGDNAFWTPIDNAGPEFWANLDWMSDGKRLWHYIRKYNPYILSSPSRSATSKVGKAAWCSINLFNQYKKLLLYPRHEKQTFSAHNHILIDDLENTINEWNKKGGIGILHISAENTINELRKLGI
jgi:hypothetical protein